MWKDEEYVYIHITLWLQPLYHKLYSIHMWPELGNLTIFIHAQVKCIHSCIYYHVSHIAFSWLHRTLSRAWNYSRTSDIFQSNWLNWMSGQFGFWSDKMSEQYFDFLNWFKTSYMLLSEQITWSLTKIIFVQTLCPSIFLDQFQVLLRSQYRQCGTSWGL